MKKICLITSLLLSTLAMANSEKIFQNVYGKNHKISNTSTIKTYATPPLKMQFFNWLKWNKRSIQYFSYILSHVPVAIEAEYTSLKISEIALAVTKECKTGKKVSSVTISGKSISIGWREFEGKVTSFNCTVKEKW